jgi:hypothetical protein
VVHSPEAAFHVGIPRGEHLGGPSCCDGHERPLAQEPVRGGRPDANCLAGLLVYGTPARAKNAEVTAAVEVVMTNHGRLWTGVRFEWTERLRLGYPGIL